MEALSRNSLRIAHVEDDEDFAAISERFLNRAGFEQPIVQCKDGTEALRYFSTMEPQQAPHLILLDLDIPHINGLEVLRRLRIGHATRDLPIYLLTSSENPEDRRRAINERVTGYLIKAAAFDELIWHLDQQIAMFNQRNVHGTGRDQITTDERVELVGEDLYFEGFDYSQAPDNEPK
jgi:DNA-binding response OmpR family regulator